MYTRRHTLDCYTVTVQELKTHNMDSNKGFWIDGPGRPDNCGMIGLESIIIGFAPRSSVENVIVCVCWQLR